MACLRDFVDQEQTYEGVQVFALARESLPWCTGVRAVMCSLIAEWYTVIGWYTVLSCLIVFCSWYQYCVQYQQWNARGGEKTPERIFVTCTGVCVCVCAGERGHGGGERSNGWDIVKRAVGCLLLALVSKSIPFGIDDTETSNHILMAL